MYSKVSVLVLVYVWCKGGRWEAAAPPLDTKRSARSAGPQ